jgi:tetratricopeptide (TPR) repeat protein
MDRRTPRQTRPGAGAGNRRQPGPRPTVGRRPDEQPSNRPPAPPLPEDVERGELEPELRAGLRALPTGLAELVGKHLMAAAAVGEDDPQLALAHARFARTRAARVAMVRELAGVIAYEAGEWAEALAELRTARRLGGGPGLLALMADCERGLGRPERALELARSAQAAGLAPEEAAELRIVAAGARRDLGQLDAAVVELQGPDLDLSRRDPWSSRLFYAYADALAATGRTDEAVRWFVAAADADEEGDTDAAQRAMELREPRG